MEFKAPQSSETYYSIFYILASTIRHVTISGTGNTVFT